MITRGFPDRQVRARLTVPAPWRRFTSAPAIRRTTARCLLSDDDDNDDDAGNITPRGDRLSDARDRVDALTTIDAHPATSLHIALPRAATQSPFVSRRGPVALSQRLPAPLKPYHHKLISRQ